MADSMAGRTGGCLCGSVRYRAGGPLREVLQCHCENCRRLSGNFVAASRTEFRRLDITDSAGAFRWHDLGYAKYGFCSNCGSTLFYQAEDGPEIVSVMVGTLDDASGLHLGGVWFSDHAQPHNTLPADVARFGGNA